MNMNNNKKYGCGLKVKGLERKKIELMVSLQFYYFILLYFYFIVFFLLYLLDIVKKFQCFMFLVFFYLWKTKKMCMVKIQNRSVGWKFIVIIIVHEYGTFTSDNDWVDNWLMSVIIFLSEFIVCFLSFYYLMNLFCWFFVAKIFFILPIKYVYVFFICLTI